MKGHWLCIFLVCGCRLLAQNGSNEDLLHNADVIYLSRNGVSTAIVKAKIGQAKTAFNVSGDSLLLLKKAGVGDDIILAMIAKTASPAKLPSEKSVGLAPGWYYKTGESFHPLEEVPLTVRQSSGIWGITKKVCNAIVPLNIHADVAGASATVKIKELRPVYYYVPDSLLSPADPQTPNDYMLVRMTEKEGNRGVTFRKPVVPPNAPRQEPAIQVNDDDRVPFRSKRLAEGVYEVQCTGSLQPGEYCFMITRSTYYVGNSYRIFDFTCSNN